MATIFSLGSFYIGVDDEKFNDIQIHLGKLRIEYTGQPIKTNNHGPSSPSVDGQEDGTIDESNQSPPTL